MKISCTLTALLLLLFAHKTANAQFAGGGKKLDSLIKNLEHFSHQDTFRLNALEAILEQAVANAAPYKAEKYYAEAMALAKKFNQPVRIANCYHFMGWLYNSKKKYDTALIWLDSAILAYKQCPDSIKRDWGIATIYRDKGRVYSLSGDSYSQLQMLLQSLDLYEKIKSENASQTAMSISLLYRDLSNTEKDLEYSKMAEQFAEAYGGDEMKIRAYLNNAESQLNAKDPIKALSSLDKSKSLIFNSGNIYHKWSYYLFLGRSHQLQKNYGQSLQDFLQALDFARKAGHETFIQDVLAYLTFAYLQTPDWKNSKPYLDQYFELSKNEHPSINERESLRRLAEYYERTGAYEKSNVYSEWALKVNDSLLLEENAEQLNKLEAKYQFEKKENEIKQLQKDVQLKTYSLRERSTINYIFAGTTLGALLVGFLFFRNYKNRQKLQSQQIRELEKDKQLAVTDSILKGQEKERERLAKDLHDGLGGLLSGAKLSLANVKSNMVISGENAQIFEHSLNLVDTSIRELRRVAHNMMPEALLKSGLAVALNDYCKSLNTSTNLKVTFQHYGSEIQIENTDALIIYRIVQELINNVLKHAGATEMLVQVAQREHSVSITVEDNGSGFNAQQPGNAAGAGWKNIRSRVEYLKGTIDIKSEPGKGSSVNIEVNV